MMLCYVPVDQCGAVLQSRVYAHPNVIPILRYNCHSLIDRRVTAHAVKFTKDHEWLSVEGDVATIGITNYAQVRDSSLIP